MLIKEFHPVNWIKVNSLIAGDRLGVGACLLDYRYSRTLLNIHKPKPNFFVTAFTKHSYLLFDNSIAKRMKSTTSKGLHQSLAQRSSRYKSAMGTLGTKEVTNYLHGVGKLKII